MKAVFAPKYIFDKNTLVERSLPVDGKVLVSEKSTVSSFDILAKCKVHEEEQFFSYEGKLLKNKGDYVSQGELVSTSKKSKSLFTGYITQISETKKELCVRKPGKEISLMAEVPGSVYKIQPNRGVLLKLSALRVVGVAGYGDTVSGELVVIGNHGGVLKEDKLDTSFLGKIIVCGFLNKESYAKAKAIGVLGFICGSTDAAFFTSLKMGGPEVVVLEGFGDIPAFPIVFDYFKKVAPRHVVLRSCESEVIIPESKKPDWSLEKNVDTAQPCFIDLTIGSFVQIFVHPYYGYIGTVIEISEKIGKIKVTIWEKEVDVDLSVDDILVISIQ